MKRAKYKKGDKLFIKDRQWGRVFPVVVTDTSEVLEQDSKITHYSIKLQDTPGVRDELAFHGAAKPCLFYLDPTKLYNEHELFEDKQMAYKYLIGDYEAEKMDLEARLKELPQIIQNAKERMNEAAEQAGSQYKLGSQVWVIADNNVYEATIDDFDRGDFQNKPYHFKESYSWHSGWIRLCDIFDTKQAAVDELRARLRKECEERCAKVGA